MKTKNLILLALVIGGGYWYYKKYMQKPKVTQPGTPDVPVKETIVVNENFVKSATDSLNNSNLVQTPILEQIKELSKPKEIASYQTFYGTISGKKVGVPYSI